jgi:hypothetical protein
MENRDQEVTSFVATFENHYKAMLFRKGMGPVCTLRPVPRCLSSSCGTSAFFTLEVQADTSAKACSSVDTLSQELKALVESIYEFKNGEYHEVYKN